MSYPAAYALEVYRGDSDDWNFMLFEDEEMTVPYDITGATAKAQIREGRNSLTGVLGDVLAELTCTVTPPNQVGVELLAEDSALLPVGRTAEWDLELTLATGKVKTIVRGPVCVSADVTQPALPG